MTPYFDAYNAALAQQDAVTVTLGLMAAGIIAAWVLYTDLIRPQMQKQAPQLVPLSFRVFIFGGFAMYWGTVALYVMEASKQ